MEQNKEYQNVVATINNLEQQLTKCGDATQVQEQYVQEAKRKIDDHFAQCMNALAARKEALIRDLNTQAETQKAALQSTKDELNLAVDACKQLLNVGSYAFKGSAASAEIVWKNLSVLNLPQLSVVGVVPSLPPTLLQAITSHGAVEIFAHGAKDITTLAGSTAGCKDGQGAQAQFNVVYDLCFNSTDSCFYACDYNNSKIQKITLQGLVTSYQQVPNPTGIAFSRKDNCLFVSSSSTHSIHKITSAGVVSVLAGTEIPGNTNGNGTTASFSNPRGIAVDQQNGTLFVADYDNSLIRKITPQGEVSTFAGSARGYADGNGATAKFNRPWGLHFDGQSQSLLVCDYSGSRIRKVQLNGDVSTVCAVPSPYSITMAPDRTILVSSNHRIYKVTGQGSANCEAVFMAGTSVGSNSKWKAYRM